MRDHRLNDSVNVRPAESSQVKPSALRNTRTQIHLTDGGYFDAPVDYCKAKTLVIQQGTLPWK